MTTPVQVRVYWETEKRDLLGREYFNSIKENEKVWMREAFARK